MGKEQKFARGKTPTQKKIIEIEQKGGSGGKGTEKRLSTDSYVETGKGGRKKKKNVGPVVNGGGLSSCIRTFSEIQFNEDKIS